MVAIDGFSRSRSNTYNLGSSYASSITGLPRQDSNASSDEQSLSPSTGASEGDLHDPQLLFVPTMNSSPRTPMKATTLPRSSPGDASFRLGEASSQKGGDVMTLEDFLAESDKTPKSKVSWGDRHEQIRWTHRQLLAIPLTSCPISTEVRAVRCRPVCAYIHT